MCVCVCSIDWLVRISSNLWGPFSVALLRWFAAIDLATPPARLASVKGSLGATRAGASFSFFSGALCNLGEVEGSGR